PGVVLAQARSSAAPFESSKRFFMGKVNSFRQIILCALVSALLTFSQACAQPPAPKKEKELDFHPKLVLKWPDKFTESRHASKTDDGEEKHYSASCAIKKPEGVILFSAFVTELPEKAVKGLSSKQLLALHTFAFKNDETNRKEIEHGAKKCPGLDITSKTAKFFGHKIIVVVGPRIYEVGVMSGNEGLIKVDEVKAFLASLAVGD
ncbi:MAG TPA: hypothetical protein VKS79_09700, partial [Gemmataceae bacterium]|nr:hypothetical protein [Gemmataceae bacterium]